MGVEEALDILLLFMMLMIFTPFTIRAAIALQDPAIYGFGGQEEKSLMEGFEFDTEKAVDPSSGEILLRGYDLFGMITVGDSNQPLTGEIRFPDGTRITYDQEFKVYRQYFLRDLYAFFELNPANSPQDFYLLSREFHTGTSSCDHNPETSTNTDCSARAFRNWRLSRVSSSGIPMSQNIPSNWQ